MRRLLSETLTDLSGAAFAVRGDGPRVRITELVIDVPIEVRLRRNQTNTQDQWELLGDVPQWRWQTGLEELLGRIRVRWEMT